MTISKRLLALLMALAMCFALAACQSGDADVSPSADPSASPSGSADPSESPEIVADLSQTLYGFASGLKDEDTAATVNGVAIPNELFLYWLSSDCYYMDSFYSQYDLVADFTDQELVDYLRSDVQTAVTYYAVLRELCEENGITVTDEQEAELQQQIDEYEAEHGEGSMLRSYGLTEESFRYVTTNGFLFTNLADKLVGQPTDADLEQYVTDNSIYSVKHILLKTTKEDVTDDDGNVTQTADEYNAEMKALAEDLLAQLQASGDLEADFDKLMNEYSEDTGLASYPDGYTAVPGDMVEEFETASLALEVGALSGVVESTHGYHIILRQPVDASAYHDNWISDSTDALVMERVETAQVTVSEEISSLDISSFYSRFSAYVTALYNEDSADK